MKVFTHFLFLFLMFQSYSVFSQNKVKGRLVDEYSKEPIIGVLVQLEGSSASTFTDREGLFFLDGVPEGNQVLKLSDPAFDVVSIPISVKAGMNDIGSIVPAEKVNQQKADLSPVLTISDLQADNASFVPNISGMLTSSNDPFVNAAFFNLSAGRFRIRGLESDYNLMYVNGAPMNDLETGDVYWGTWGGLNDVMRGRSNMVGLGATDYTLGGIGGSSFIDASAGNQRKQLRASYAISNRTYQHRAMLTYTSGMSKKGWAVALSGSRRWADESYMPGTYYDAWSFFASVEKEINKKHSMSLTIIGSPSERGRSNSAVQELFNLTGSNYYNPNWGYQVGKKRNANVNVNNQPMAILNHDWKISDKAAMKTALSAQIGYNGSSALDWYDGADPRADYYRRIPTYIGLRGDTAQARITADLIRNDPNLVQIDWAAMYEANRNNRYTVQNPSNNGGAPFEGKRSNYILSERGADVKKYNLNTYLNYQATSSISFAGGAMAQYHQSDNYQKVKDLLGGDFYLDLDRFAERDFPDNPSLAQNNLDEPNKVLKVGDKYGYNYRSNIWKTMIWQQTRINLRKVDFFVGAQAGFTNFWRTGIFKNGRFPDQSQGEGAHHAFLNYQLKAGITYKINGRNYLYANGSLGQEAPDFRNAYVSVRSRDQLLPNVGPERQKSGEVGFVHTSPSLKLRATAFYIYFENQVWSRSFFMDNAYRGADGLTQSGFLNYVMTGINKEHQGIEFAAEYKINAAWRTYLSGSMGQYTFASRPQVTLILDNDINLNIPSTTAYIQNYRLPTGPQTAGTFGLSYNSPKFWFVRANVNLFADNYVDINPSRRTLEAVSTVPGTPSVQEEAIVRGSEQWRQILDQEKLPTAITVDLFAGKSFKFGKHFLNLNVGVSNILNNKSMVLFANEQFRFDTETKQVQLAPTEYAYGMGLNYFVNLSWRM